MCIFASGIYYQLHLQCGYYINTMYLSYYDSPIAGLGIKPVSYYHEFMTLVNCIVYSLCVNLFAATPRGELRRYVPVL